MTSTLLKYNVILIALCIGMTLVHNSSQVGDGEVEAESKTKVEAVKKTFNLYYTPGSPPCRSVLLTAKALDLTFDLKTIDLFESEHLTDDFKKMNPKHTIPTIKDGEFVLWESRAIIVYLVLQYGKGNNPLYPEDNKKQAVINQLLQFDFNTLYPAFSNQYYPWLFGKEPKPADKDMQLYDALAFLETLLGSNDWFTGDSVTLADIVLVASISTFEVVGVELEKHVNVYKWLQRCKTKMEGYDDANQLGINVFQARVNKKLLAPVINKEQGNEILEVEHTKERVYKLEVLDAINILRRVVMDHAIGEKYSTLLNNLEEAMNVLKMLTL